MTTYINASCACELNTFRVAFDTASLPIVNDLCHCNTCRHSSGQMAVYHVTIQGVPYTRLHESGSHSASRSGYSSDDGTRKGNGRNDPDRQLYIQNGLLVPPIIAIAEPEPTPYILDDLTTYNTSPDITRYFCGSCSAHLFWVHHKDSGDSWAVAVGALHRTDGVVKIGYHIWVGDTLDGGLADHLRTIDGKELLRYKGDMGSDELPVGWRAPSIAGAQVDGKEEEDQLRGFCLCGTIEFAITRPSEPSTLPSSSYPDLLCAYDVSHLSKIANTRDEKWWLRPTGSLTPTKYLAGHCMCGTCRQSSGFEIQSWAFIPLDNIVRAGSTPLCLEIEGERPQGLKQYISSPGRYRESCGTCGATVFMWQAGVPDLVWVSVGLLDEKVSGARAEDWLEWHKGRVSFGEQALSRAVAKGLELGLKIR